MTFSTTGRNNGRQAAIKYMPISTTDHPISDTGAPFSEHVSLAQMFWSLMGGIVQIWSVKRSVVRMSENRYMDANMPLERLACVGIELT
jgi:hypothetical protein